MNTDTWPCAAQALREAALGHPAVVMLVEQPPYETPGCEDTVPGIALRGDAHLFTAHIGLVLDLAYVLDHSLDALTQEIRTDLMTRWHQLDPNRLLVIHLDIVDLVSV